MRRFLFTLVVLTASSVASACDWPQWLGERRDGSTTEIVVPWKGDLKVLWKQIVGEGHSSPIVAGDRAFLHTRFKDTTQEVLAAYSASDGKPLWSKTQERRQFQELVRQRSARDPSGQRHQNLHLWHHGPADMPGCEHRGPALGGQRVEGCQGGQPLLWRLLLAAS